MNAAPSRTFLDHPQADLAAARAVFVPLPFDGTASYMKGTAAAPAAILAASTQLESYEEEVGWEPTENVPLRCLEPVEPRQGEAVEAYLARVEEALRPLPPEAVTIGLGGEHSMSWPLVKRLLGPGDTMVVFDAHPDLRESYIGSRHSHGAISRRVHDDLGVNLVQIGLGCISAEEAAFVREAKGVEQHWAWELCGPDYLAGLVKRLGELTGRVYVSVDVDGLSTAIVPGTGTPVAGGLEWHPFVSLLRAILSAPKATVVGMDVVEVRPLPDSPLSEFTAAKIIQKFLSFRFRPER